MAGKLGWTITVPAVDTNILLRWILDDVPEQTARVDRLLASQDQLVGDDAVIIESVFVLERVVGLGRSVIAEAIECVIAEARFGLDRAHWARVLDDYVDHPALSIADTHLAHRAQERGETLYTFDKKLAKQLGSVQLA